MRKLYRRRLRFRQMQFILKVLVHRVNQAIAESPEQKQRGDKNKREHDILALVRNEQAFLLRNSGGFHFHLILYR